MLYENPDPPVAVAFMAPSFCPLVAGVSTAVMFTVMPAQTFMVPTVNWAEPVHPFAFFAVMVYVPEARPLKVPAG